MHKNAKPSERSTLTNVFDLIEAVKSTAVTSIVPIDGIDLVPKYPIRIPLDSEAISEIAELLKEKVWSGQVIRDYSSNTIRVPEPFYGIPMVERISDASEGHTFKLLTQFESVLAHRLVGLRHLLVKIVSGSDDALFLAAVSDNTGNDRGYSIHELSVLESIVTRRFHGMEVWELIKLLGCEPRMATCGSLKQDELSRKLELIFERVADNLRYPMDPELMFENIYLEYSRYGNE